MKRLVVTIDGPAASGKSTVARLLAERLHAVFLDTGAMYRAAAVAANRAGVDLCDEKTVTAAVKAAELSFVPMKGGMRVFLDGAEIAGLIRTPEVSEAARQIASLESVRKLLVGAQRRFAADYERIVTEGRDQGTVVFPSADVKFYLVARVEERARRRCAEMLETDLAADLELVTEAIRQRDRSDSLRSAGPMKPAPDAVRVDTSDMGIEQVVEQLVGFVRQKCREKL